MLVYVSFTDCLYGRLDKGFRAKPMVKHSTPLQKTESLRRPKNADVRSREYLRPEEVGRLISAAKSIGHHKNRDTLLILMMFRYL
jgi:hypothetical protein